MDGVDAVVHLAALISIEESFKNSIETHNVNVTGTLNVLEEAARMNIEKFIYASSTAVYGDGNPCHLERVTHLSLYHHTLHPKSQQSIIVKCSTEVTD